MPKLHQENVYNFVLSIQMLLLIKTQKCAYKVVIHHSLQIIQRENAYQFVLMPLNCSEIKIQVNVYKNVLIYHLLILQLIYALVDALLAYMLIQQL